MQLFVIWLTLSSKKDAKPLERSCSLTGTPFKVIWFGIEFVMLSLDKFTAFHKDFELPGIIFFLTSFLLFEKSEILSQYLKIWFGFWDPKLVSFWVALRAYFSNLIFFWQWGLVLSELCCHEILFYLS